MRHLSGRLKRFVLFTRCLLAALIRGAADMPPTNPATIIVVPTGKLGDIVCCTPVFRALRARLPHARLVALGPKLVEPLLEHSGLVDAHIDIGADNAIDHIRAEHADAAVVLGPSFGSAVLLCLAHLPLVVIPKVVGGYSPNETRLYKLLSRFVATYPYHRGEYAPRERLRALEPLGIVIDDTTKKLGFSDAGAATAAQFLADNSIDPKKDFVVGISPSAGNKIKEWPAERFAQVADYLIEKYDAKIVIIGSAADAAKAAEMKQYLHTPVADATGAFDLDTLKASISKLSLFISVDTGPIYIAEAFNVPTIDIVGPVDEKVQPPRGPLHRNVIPERTHPMLSILNARSYDETEAVRQVNSITVAAVTHELDLLIAAMRGV
ncbi:MAG: glycosyltransferase family 9 protein [Candidatus Pacebacteria bacterium]|nr:glycosyltransferase family 9 protein [Candidatus Paceibacterota bacterium]